VKAAFYGRIVFGVSAVLSGILTVLWHDSDAWQRLHPLGMVSSAIIVWCLAIAQILGGILLFAPRTVRIASIVLGVAYAFTALLCVPAMFANALDAGQYVDFFEQLSIAIGALAVYISTDPNDPRSAALSRVARLGMGICAISFAWAQVVYLQYTASLVPTWIPPGQLFWTNLTTVAFALAGLAMLIDRQAQLAMRLMALMIALLGLLVWGPRAAVHPKDLSIWNEIAANYLIGAASLLVAELRPARAAETVMD
jgi:uncharacterized membrane protein YphA (DoxX/SURF4 family)